VNILAEHVGREEHGIQVQDLDMPSWPRERAKAAIVVGSDVAFGMGRMVELRAEDRSGSSFRIFRDIGEASRWLGIE
jgi:hypothetical protein